jgi:DNA-binding transcriptional ArsR family regulator
MMVKRAPVSEAELEQLASMFRLLSDRTRLNLLLMLGEGERNVTSLCEALQLPQPTVSHHLGLLRMSNVIENRRDGKQVFYALNGRVGIMDDRMLQVATDHYNVRISPK